ncbi:MAG: hypothetical protein ACOCTG_00360, partial [Bacteroidota bacterium]
GQRILAGADAIVDLDRVFAIGEVLVASLDPHESGSFSPFGVMGRLGYRALPTRMFVVGVDYLDPDRDVPVHDDVLLSLAAIQYLSAHVRLLADYTFAPDDLAAGNLIVRMAVRF